MPVGCFGRGCWPGATKFYISCKLMAGMFAQQDCEQVDAEHAARRDRYAEHTMQQLWKQTWKEYSEAARPWLPAPNQPSRMSKAAGRLAMACGKADTERKASTATNNRTRPCSGLLLLCS